MGKSLKFSDAWWPDLHSKFAWESPKKTGQSNACHGLSSLSAALIVSSDVFSSLFFSSKGTISPVHTMISTLNDPAFNCSSLCSCLASCLIKMVETAFPLVSSKQKHLYGQRWAYIAQVIQAGDAPILSPSTPLSETGLHVHACLAACSDTNECLCTQCSISLLITDRVSRLIALPVCTVLLSRHLLTLTVTLAASAATMWHTSASVCWLCWRRK